jgi:hypothetical protein
MTRKDQLTTTPAKATAAPSPARRWWKPIGPAIAAAAIAQRSTLLGLGANDHHRALTFSAADIAEYRGKVYVTTVAPGQHAMPGFDVLSGVFGVRPDGGGFALFALTDDDFRTYRNGPAYRAAACRFSPGAASGSARRPTS